MLTDNITVNLLIHYQGTGGGASAAPLGGQFINYNDGTANSVYARLTGHASPGDTTFSSLSKTQTNGGQSQVAVWDAQLKAMGIAVTDTDDGQATFATDIAGTSQVGVALHEFTHALPESLWPADRIAAGHLRFLPLYQPRNYPGLRPAAAAAAAGGVFLAE